MLHTHQDQDSVNRPIAYHRWKPDRSLVIALIEMRLLELPPNSIRRQTLEQMIERTAAARTA